MNGGRPINEDDLQGYVDDALDSRRRAEVETHLIREPELAERVAKDIELRAALRAALAPIASEPVPPELNLASLIERRHRHSSRRQTQWRAAASIALLLGGGAGGWSLRSFQERPSAGIASLAQEATDSYAVYAPDTGRPVEIKAGDEAQLITWASRRLERPVSIPDLSASGYHFLGGRVVPTPHGPAALYMFDNDRGTRLVLLARNMKIDRDAPMIPNDAGTVRSISWSRNGLGFSLVGPLGSAVLDPIATSVQSQTGSKI